MKQIKSTSKLLLAVFAFGLLFLNSCKNYYISIDSFKQQFTITDSSQLKPVVLGGGALLYTEKYFTKDVDSFDCIDKRGRHHSLIMSPKLEVAVSYQKGDKVKKAYFYLDRTYVGKDSVTGYRSRFFGLPKNIPLQNLKQIKVQNGHKNYYYLNP